MRPETLARRSARTSLGLLAVALGALGLFSGGHFFIAGATNRSLATTVAINEGPAARAGVHLDATARSLVEAAPSRGLRLELAGGALLLGGVLTTIAGILALLGRMGLLLGIGPAVLLLGELLFLFFVGFATGELGKALLMFVASLLAFTLRRPSRRRDVAPARGAA
jgi:hypothetical protein